MVIAAAAAPTLEELFEVPSCDRQAALGHWSRGVLFGTEARSAWVEPDVAALPWAPEFDELRTH